MDRVYEVYALFLKDITSCNIKYSRQNYDYQQGNIVCFAPGQVVGIDAVKEEVQPEANEDALTKFEHLLNEYFQGQIADGLGFQYPQHLNRLFKKCVGRTPNEYRLQNE